MANESEDYGRILENVVFIELFGREGNIENKSIFYFKSSAGRECDFVIKRKGKIRQVIQVTKELNDKNKEREIEGMVTAMEFFKLKKGLILTLDQKDELIIDGKKIIVQPIWKWLLE